jgi:o-succinylbenzoate synthase
MRIVAAAIERLRLPLRRPLATARGTLRVREGCVLRLTARDGEIGVGEASPAYWIDDAPLAAVRADLDHVVARVRARPRANELRAWLGEHGTRVLAPAAACALDAALLDLEARAQGMSVAIALGGRATTTVPIAALVGGSTPDELGADAALARAHGFATVKLKVGGGPLAEDLARVAAVRTSIGREVALRLDANRAWTLDVARRALDAFAPFVPAYVEEPLLEGAPRALAALAAESPVALAVDESVRTAADLEDLVACGARVHVVLKAARVGGPTRLVALARTADAAGMPVTVTDAIESAVGMQVAVHAAAALRAATAVGLGGAQLLRAAVGRARGQLDALRAPAVVARGPGLDVTAATAPRSAFARA